MVDKRHRLSVTTHKLSFYVFSLPSFPVVSVMHPTLSLERVEKNLGPVCDLIARWRSYGFLILKLWYIYFYFTITKNPASMWNSDRVGPRIVEQSPSVIVLTTQMQICHLVHVYYVIELFDIFCSISCVLYRILDTRNIDLSLRDLLGLPYTPEKEIAFSPLR